MSQVHLVVEFVDLGYVVKSAYTDKAKADSECAALRETYKASSQVASRVAAESIYQVESIEIKS